MDKQPLLSTLHTADLTSYTADCIVFPCYENQLNLSLYNFEKPLLKHLESVVESEAFTAQSKQLLIVHNAFHSGNKEGIRKLVFIGLGKAEKATWSSLKSACDTCFSTLTKHAQQSLHFVCWQREDPNSDLLLHSACNSFLRSQYQFGGYKTKSNKRVNQHLIITTKEPRELQAKFDYWQAESTGMVLAKNLANMAANHCTPDFLAQEAVTLAENWPSVKTRIINEQQLTELDMHAYLAVNQASPFKASMPVIEYRGAQSDVAPIVLIGKGVTFDTGGITLKRADGMQHMIYDMAGAATVLGLINAIAELALPINVTGILATAENCIDGNAYRPGDVIKTKDGLTVEIISTDAEGRMLLCDAITYAKCLKPKAVIDLATLTGAAITALGHEATGLMSNSNSLQTRLLNAADASFDKAWPFPIWPEYADALRSTSADIKNTGSNSPGMITAGCFLSLFAQGLTWAHLDIAGSSFKYGKQNTATGRPLPLLLRYLCEVSHSSLG